jgi:hypothetical protein
MEALSQRAVKTVKAVRGVAGERGVDLDDKPAFRFEAEALVFEITQTFREQTRTGKQYERERGLQND